jgi:hypothetical protein
MFTNRFWQEAIFLVAGYEGTKEDWDTIGYGRNAGRD